ncbi:cytochrome P450 [Aspergillus crustosus]
MLFYRAFWHRLSSFPGPFWARLTNLYVTALSAKRLRLYEEIQKLHQQYGDYGPTELSIADPQAVKALYSSQAKVSKGPWYTVLEPRVSLQMEREKKAHAHRRKVWDQGFGSKAAYILKKLHGDIKSIGLFSYLTWLFPLFKRVPILNRDYLPFWDWIGERVAQRRRADKLDAFPDLSYKRLTSVKLFNTLINKTLRIHPVVPSGTQRMTPPEGIQIGNRYIPGDIIVNHRVFVRPAEFHLSALELVKDPAAFIPFNAGPYSWVGKQLALMEIRRVTADILSRCDVVFAEGQTEEAFMEGKRDTFTLVTAPLELVFKERKRNRA